MNINSIEKLLIEELGDLHSAERQITKALPKMIKAATSKELQSALEHHLRETEGHVQRLEEAFKAFGTNASSKTCEGMKGIIEEGERSMKSAEEGEFRDLAIISGAQRVEHYEMAAYGSARTFARLLGQEKAAELLQSTLDEESETNESLNQLAESMVNPEALSGTELTADSRQ